MAWYKVDDKLHSHPKARRAGLAAMGLWSLAGSHCMDYLTDGIIERWFVESWPNGNSLAERLVDVGLWDEHPEGWEFHDWGEYQPTREKVLAEREKTKQRVERFRNGGGNGVTNGVGTASPSPVPSPLPTKTSKSQSSNNRAREEDETNEAPARAIITGLSIDPDKLIAHIERRTARTVTPTVAMRVALDILDRAGQIKTNPQRYVLGSISRSWAEVQQFIDTSVA